MPKPETMTTSTARFLRQARDWLPANHPLAVALRRTAAELDASYQASVMSQYVKLIQTIEARRPATGQAVLPDTAPVAEPDGLHLIGPRRIA